MVAFPAPTAWESMKDEYQVLGLHPSGHITAQLRPNLSQGLCLSRDIAQLRDGAVVTAAGLVIRRQRPHGKVAFITLEDEFGHIPLMVFPQVYKQYEHSLKSAIIVVKGRLTQRAGTTLSYIHQDSLSSSSAMSSSTGTLTGSIKYFPFGATRSGSVPTDKQYTGQRLDGTGLYYYGARYYDPVISRFISADAVSPDLTNPQSLSKYTYCFNNPLKLNDPTGRWPNFANIGKAIAKGAQAAANFVKKNIDVIQTALDVAGMIPVIGEICDVASGVISICKGDLVGAGLSLMSAIPVVGNVTGIAKTAKNAVKLIDKVDNISAAGKLLGKLPTYSELKAITKGTGKEAHHLIEKRFAKALGIDPNNIPSIALAKGDHQSYTNLWREAIGYNGDNALKVTGDANWDDIWDAAQKIYGDDPDLLSQINEWLLGIK